MEIVGNVKNYDWGKIGEQSYVAQLAKANSDTLEIKDDCPYAELWMGDHVNGPATLKRDGTTLQQAIQNDPVGMIGKETASQLPFLLKVLSIRKALSVQVHPDKVEAEKLHEKFPDVYKDPNHKPELAIALTEFQALCGFRQYDATAELLNASRELRVLLGEDVLQKFAAKEEDAVKVAYERLMHSDQSAIERCINSIAERIRTGEPALLDKLFQRLYDDFGADVGVLSIYFLNYLRLKPGQAIYLAANVPHAYLDGDCVECMACSDNVVRAGLTPKFKDVDTLLRLVSYRCAPANSMIFQPKLLQPTVQPHTKTFLPPVKDFAVSEIRLPAPVREYTLSNPANGSVLLVLGGKGRLPLDQDEPIELGFGKICFLPSKLGRTVKLEVDATGEEFLAFQAMSNDFEATDN
ncbi:mannose-6-phosphate isomerase [Anopheles ziemanni]|uniref:mannose-6-phosphate isomerase n=1 Tax=Anopheles coustani TaxID=139045 RepID=UPI00265B6FD3|nr:mannose-6-phosphate isomerase [Anopheles coustani]XP_058176465.1 mannose-6-phosphate isomerase [Anopheles ziemanni]